MKNILEGIGNLKNKWLGLSNTGKVASGILALVIFSALVFLIISSTTTKYGVLFSGLNSSDSATIISKLKTDKVPYEVQGNSIYVPESEVDELRLQYDTSITNGTTGFELFDNTSQFGMTDQQFNVTYQRALEGELERTIMGFSQIADDRVELAMPDSSVFVQDQNSGTASVFLKMKSGETLTKSQVKAIVALVSGAVKNLPAANIQVVDDNMNVLTDNSKDGSTDLSSSSTEKNQVIDQTENELQEKALAQLEPIYGEGNVKVQVNADMNFDSNQQTSTVKSNPIIVSQDNKTSGSSNGGTLSNSGSPTTNNYNNSNQIVNNSSAGYSYSNEVTTNYDNSTTQTTTTKSPGDVTRLTVSVVVNKTLNQNDQTAINNIVSQAVGLNAQRGDSISIEGMKFNTTLQNNAKAAIAQMNQAAQTKQRYEIIAAAVGGVLLLIFAIILFIRSRRRKNNDEVTLGENIDAKIADNISPKEATTSFEPIKFEEDNMNLHMEKEIKQYANTKPDQVADVVKAWLSEEER